jgi:hypothetical protein
VAVLVTGGGGREHALCYALQRSSSRDAVFCAPGNAGIADSGDATCISDLDIHNSSVVISFCQRWGVGLVVVGPEGPLVAGLVNDLVKAGIPTFGPSSEAAALEGSKDFSINLHWFAHISHQWTICTGSLVWVISEHHLGFSFSSCLGDFSFWLPAFLVMHCFTREGFRKTGDRSELWRICVARMGGSGKTLMLMTLFNSERVRIVFFRLKISRIWCSNGPYRI